MGKLNMKEWISQTIQRKETIAIPIMTHPGIEFIGKTVHDAVRLSFRKMRCPVCPAVCWRMKLLLKSWKFRR